MWTKFQLKPLILDPNRNIHVSYACWGGGPLALSLGCCQELRRIALKYFLSECQKIVFQKRAPCRVDKRLSIHMRMPEIYWRFLHNPADEIKLKTFMGPIGPGRRRPAGSAPQFGDLHNRYHVINKMTQSVANIHILPGAIIRNFIFSCTGISYFVAWI